MKKLVIALALAFACVGVARAESTYLGVDQQDVNIAAQDGAVMIESTTTIPVSAASLPLPSGAATSANQATANGHLSTIAGDTTSIDGKIPAQGAATTANSLPVNIASDQTVPVSATDLDIRDLTGASDNVNLNDGTDALDINSNGSLNVQQSTHDNLNANVNLQVGDVDVSGGNPVPVTGTFNVDGSSIQSRGYGEFAYAVGEDIACAPTNVSFTGLVDEVELQAINGTCTYTILGGSSMTLRRNTAKTLKLNYTASGTASTVSCTAKDGGATCNVYITGGN